MVPLPHTVSYAEHEMLAHLKIFETFLFRFIKVYLFPGIHDSVGLYADRHILTKGNIIQSPGKYSNLTDLFP